MTIINQDYGDEALSIARDLFCMANDPGERRRIYKELKEQNPHLYEQVRTILEDMCDKYGHQ